MRRKHLRDAAMLNLSSAGEKAVTLLRSSDFNQSQLQFTTRSERVITQSQSQRLSWDGGGANSQRVKKGNRSQGHRPELPLCREDQIVHEEQYIKSDYDKGKDTYGRITGKLMCEKYSYQAQNDVAFAANSKWKLTITLLGKQIV